MAQSSSPAPPPLLLTKRITGFLAHALSAHIHTALLCSPAGKLLAHVSAPLRPVADLRMQATVAASLVSLYAAASTQIAPALSRDDDNDDPADASHPSHSHTPTPLHHHQQQQYAEYHHHAQPDSPPSSGWATDDYAHHHAYGASPPTITNTNTGVQGPSGQPPARPHTITVQLATGAVVVRELACGLLFVCVGASSSSPQPDDTARSAPVAPAASAPTMHLHPSSAAAGSANTAAAAATAVGSTGASALLLGGLGNAAGAPAAAGSPDEADSVLSAGAMTTMSAASTTASVAAVAAVGLKKAAEEFARRLDGRLAALCVPEEGVFE